MSEKKDVVSKEKLLEAGSYFGHHASTWNPKMKPFIHMKRKKTHIIDLAKTSLAINFAYDLISKFTKKKASFIFVGTRPNAKETIKYNALRTNSFYVSERWLGGTLTNHRTILSRVKKLEELEAKEKQNYSGYTKKEGVLFAKELAKLRRNLGGIREMKFKPQLMIIADPMHDEIAVHEARKSGVKIIGIVDTNCDPTLVDIAIPANDDSIKSVTLIITLLADAIVQEKGGAVDFAFKNDEEIVLPADPIREKKEHRSFRPEDGQGFNRSNRENDSNHRDSKSRFPRREGEGYKSREFHKHEKNNSQSQPNASEGLEKLTVAELHKALEEKKIEYKSTDRKADLIKLLGGK